LLRPDNVKSCVYSIEEILSWALVTTRHPKMYCGRTWSAPDGMLMDYLNSDWHMADTFKYLYNVAIWN